MVRMSYGEFQRMMRDAKVPDDAFMIFRPIAADSNTERDITHIVKQNTYGDLHYVILGGYS